jgi:D-alanyl-lipoteichoic acid acyltransferase DltB (MBOAT superfamily)
VDFLCGRQIYISNVITKKKLWLVGSIVFNLGLLAYFKYLNFFLESLYDLASKFGISYEQLRLDIVLPVGISFYTFQTMSYSIDIFKGNLKPTEKFIDFAAFVAFFPQLVAGPIERASNLLPQVANKRRFDVFQSLHGIKIILFGLFKKVVIADTLAPIVNEVFKSYTSYDGIDLVFGVLFFAVQIYCDFSGYSDIAIGISLLLGFSLMTNFKFPYFSINISEFWKKWHISLSSWFKDYLYIPLGGNRRGIKIALRNVTIVFLVSGFWHGANWTFIVWGAIHAIFFIPVFVSKNVLIIPDNSGFFILKVIKNIFSGLFTFCVVCLAWVFFRAENLSHAIDYINNLSLTGQSMNIAYVRYVLYLIVLDVFVLYHDFLKQNLIRNIYVRYTIYSMIILSILSHTTLEGSDFIYFQF